MARRSAPPNSGPSYLPPTLSSRGIDPDESRLQRFLREEIFAPEKLPGNFAILTGLTLFFGGIGVFRKWGDFLRFGNA
ncbi:hypothetical protein BU17DRAFT_97789 [Hysterangium stoloniferum]|nr:hypothetical protein BU17DRAFT_97789 [Hysterangium stoloniferum]